MQKITSRLASLLWFLLLTPLMAVAQQQEASMERALELFERRRWADARLELLRLGEQLSEEAIFERQQCDYYLALCAVELKHPDAEQVLLNFRERHPGSLLNNDIRFALASYYCTEENYTEAERLFDEVKYRALGSDNRTKYNMRRGYIAYAKGDYRTAYDYFGRVERRSHYGEHAAYYCAYIDYMLGRYDEAEKGFQSLVGSENYHHTAPFYLLQIEFRRRHYEAVTAQGGEIIDHLKGRQREELLAMLAESWFHLGKYDNALEELKRYRDEAGEMSREIAYIEGFSHYRLEHFDDSIKALREVTGPKDALTQNAAYHLADCYLRTGDKRSAMQAFSMATDKGLNDTLAEDALYNYAKLQYELDEGHFNEAINSLGRYLEEYPQSERKEEVQGLLAAAYYNSENYDAAYEAIRNHPSPDSELRAAQQKIAYFRALKCYERGELEEAARTLKEAARVGVSARYTSLASFWQGEIAFARGDYSAAANHYESYRVRAPKSEREYAFAEYSLGYCALKRGDYPKAGEYFGAFLGRYTSADNYRADAQNRRGDCYYAQRRYDEALKSYTEAQNSGLTARHYAAWQRALTLGILGRNDQKIEALKEIRRSNSGDYLDEATYELGRTYLSRSQYREGATLLEEYVSRFPNSPSYTAALSDLGMTYANLGESDQALSYYNRVIQTAPSSAEARTAMQGIREIYLARGDAEGYFTYAEQQGATSDLTERSRDSLSFSAAQRLYLADKYSDAARSLRSYIKSFPSGAYRTDAHYYLSNCYHQSGEQALEMASLEELIALGQSQYSTEALSRLAPMALEKGDYTLAADSYRRLSDYAPTEAERRAALESYVEATLKCNEAARTREMADWVEHHSESSPRALRRARHAHATELRREGELQEALALYKLLSDTEVSTAEGGEAAYRCIEALFDKGEWKQCEEQIFRLSESKNPNNYWLAESFILLGDIYLKQGDNFQARATWQSVADGYSPADDGVVEKARQRISNLKE